MLAAFLNTKLPYERITLLGDPLICVDKQD